MVQEWFANNIFTYIVLGIFAAGLLVKFLISLKYHVLIRASKRMGTSKNKLMRVLRLKFETCYKIKLGVNNVDTFVDKYVYRHRFCGIRLYTWETISGEFDIFCALSAAVFAVIGSFYRCGRNAILLTLTVGIAGSALLLAVDYFMSLKMKHAILRTNIKDYLENFLKARLENGEFSAEVLEQYKKEYYDLPQTQKESKGRGRRKQKAQIAATKSEIERAKDKKNEVDVGLKRREAKKRELKELIAADKQKDKMKEASVQEEKVRSKSQEKEKRAKEEIAASSNIQSISPYSRNAIKVREKRPDMQLEISEEEARVIGDIMKEYFS